MSEENTITSELEQEAVDRGWRPEEDWEGNKDEWRGAREFLDRGELMNTISSLNKKDKAKEDRIVKLESALQELGVHNKKLAEIEYKKAITDLKQQKAIALEEDEHSKVVEIDEQMSTLKDAKKEAEQKVSPPVTASEPTSNPHVIDWIEKNTWYDSNIAMRGSADAFAVNYISRNPDASENPEKMLKFIDQEMKTAFPDKFGEKRQRSSGTVDQTEPGSKGKGGSSLVRRLNDQQKKIGETLIKAGAFEKLNEYAQQLEELGELG